MVTSMTAIALVVFLASVVSAQSGTDQMGRGPAGLVSPVPGYPLSAQQVEELTRTAPDGTESAETMVSRIYRDTAGRMRVEWSLQGGQGPPLSIAHLIDPVGRSIAILLVDSKTAEYLVAPHSDSGPFLVAAPAVGEWPSTRKWQTAAEALGRRLLEGVEVDGERTAFTSVDQPPLRAAQEVWSSKSLGLKLLVDASGRGWSHSARLQGLDRREPDPALFLIPGDYAIRGR